MLGANTFRCRRHEQKQRDVRHLSEPHIPPCSCSKGFQTHTQLYLTVRTLAENRTKHNNSYATMNCRKTRLWASSPKTGREKNSSTLLRSIGIRVKQIETDKCYYRRLSKRFQTQSGTSKTTSERDGRCLMCFPAQSKCKVHAVRLPVQSGPRSLQRAHRIEKRTTSKTRR